MGGSLLEEIEALRRELETLAADLTRAATSAAAGAPPDEAIMISVHQACSHFGEVRGEIAKQLGQAGVVQNQPLRTVDDLARSADAARRHAQFRERVLREALEVIERTGRLRLEGQRVASLADCLDALRRKLDLSGPSELDELVAVVDGTHPVCGLLELVDGWSTLDPERWSTLVAEVGEAFGREIAAAAARGQVTFDSVVRRDESPGAHAVCPADPRAADSRTAPLDEPGSSAYVTPLLTPADVPPLASEPASAPSAPLVVPELLALARPFPNLADPPEFPDRSAPPPTSPGLFLSHEPSEPRAPAPCAPMADGSIAAAVAQAERPTHDSRSTASCAPVLDNAPSGLHPRDALTKVDRTVHRPDAVGARDPSRPASPAKNGALLERIAPSYWRLLGHGRVSLAYHLSRAAELVDGAAPAWSALAEALALNPLVPYDAEAVERLRASFSHLQGWCVESLAGEGIRPRALRMLVMAVCVRPALLASATQAATLLESIPMDGELQGLRELRSHVLNFTHLGLELSPTLLKGIREHASWADELEVRRASADAYLARARQAKIIYAPTTAVWKSWLEDDGPLGTLLGVVVRDERARVGQVRAELKRLSDRRRWMTLLEKTDQELRGRQASLRPIEARATDAIYKHAQEAMGYVQEWLDVLSAQPAASNDYQHRRADECRRDVLRSLATARVESVEFRTAGEVELACAASRLTAAFEDLDALFDPRAEAHRPGWGVDELLHAELLLVPEVRLANDDWAPAAWDEGLAELLMRTSNEVGGCPDWIDAFDRQLEAGNHAATDRLLHILSDGGESAERLDSLMTRRDRDLEERRTALGEKLVRTRTSVERAVANNLLEESTRRELLGRLEAIAPASTLDFARSTDVIEEIEAIIDERRRSAIAGVRRRLESLGSGLSTGDRARVEAALEKGNIDAANEYLALAQNGSSFAAPEDELTILRHFFPSFVEGVDELYARGKRSEPTVSEPAVLDAVRRQRALGPIDTTSIPPDRAVEAADLLGAWYEAKANRGGQKQLERLLTDVLTGLGFRVPKLSLESDPNDRRRMAFSMQCAPVIAREICAIPDYGSQAKGSYRLLCLWETLSQEEVVESIGPQKSDSTTLVLCFGRVAASARRDLARLCRERRRSFVVVDESLLLFALQCPGLRMSWVFRAAVPFTVADPYTTTAGLVPPEMFFGRQREQDLVFAAHGTSLVYGGRQLGKTALLRHVERSHHDVTNGVFVRYVDLKTEGIGIQRPSSDIWQVVAATLKKEGLLDRHITNFDPLRGRILDWLNGDPRRRIVLLLDEADAFFESDEKLLAPGGDRAANRQRFNNIWQLKGLMDETERRFKVVFAGLHNVQRISRDVNTPLAHLGEPICIGPLLERGEAREARRMITFPLSSLGYEFESPDLVLQILAYANWYPSLIQLCCKHLVEHLRKQWFDARTTPPFIITAQHIEHAIQNSDLRRAILDRFRWTLDLDPRYRVLALRIALESEERRELGEIVDGLELAWIREEALTIWRQGFGENTSRETFRTILDEMVGLGILAQIATDRYALRNPNVLKLLGTTDEIYSELLDALEKEPPPEYDPHTFRRARQGDVWVRSPLTAQQEGEILAPTKHGVSVIFGTRAAGLDDLNAFLEAPDVVDLRSLDVTELEQVLGRRVEDRSEPTGRTSERALAPLQIHVVSAGGSWTHEHVQRALAVVGRRRSTTEFSRVVFAGDGVDAWHWAGAPEQARRELLANPKLSLHGLCKWSEVAVRRWMHDAGFGPGDSKAGLEQFRKATGNWGGLLHQIGERSRENASEWSARLDEIEAELADRAQLGRWFGIVDEAWSVLELLAQPGAPLTRSDVLELCEDADPDRIRRVLRWGELVGLFSVTGREAIEIDPFLRARVAGLAR